MARELQFKSAPAYVGDTVTINAGAWSISANIEYDEHTGAPWEEHDGHGSVTAWTTRAKLPGELVLASDGRSKRFYDYAAACATARADGWRSGADAERAHKGEPDDGTKRQIAARAALADFERMRQWSADLWHWCGFVVTIENATGDEIGSASLWGIESDCGDYGLTVCNELIGEALDNARASVAGKV